MPDAPNADDLPELFGWRITRLERRLLATAMEIRELRRVVPREYGQLDDVWNLIDRYMKEGDGA